MDIPKIFIAGHKGMVGSALIRFLKKQEVQIITKDKKELDLLNQEEVKNFFKYQKIDQVYLAAAKVGGIYANNTYPAEFIYENLIIQTNIIHSAFVNGVKKLLFLGSSCIYPKNATQPIKESELLNGKLEPTNEPYALAKIAGIKMCESYNRQYSITNNIDYRSVMPTNLYGPGDNYDLVNSHVIPALIRKFYEAKLKNEKKVIVWGTGTPRREFLYVDDAAKACYYIMNLNRDTFYKDVDPLCSHINLGSGFDLTIEELAKTIKNIIGFNGLIKFDSGKPDGVKKKLLDCKRLYDLGWKPEVSLEHGLSLAIDDFSKKEKFKL